MGGWQIVKSEELEPDESQIVSTGEKAGTGTMDSVKIFSQK